MNLCGKFQAPLWLLFIWEIMFQDIYMIPNLNVLMSKFKGYHIFEKIANSSSGGPKLLAVMAKWGFANQPTMVKLIFFYNFSNKIQIKRGVNFMKL